MKIFMMKNLYVFDFDDTIVSTGSLVRIMSPQGVPVRYLTSAEFADPACEKKISNIEIQEGYYEDFSEFDVYPPDPKLIQPIFGVFKRLSDSGKNVVVVTARSNSKPVTEFLSDKMLSNIPVYAVGGSDPLLKCDKVKELLAEYNPKSVVLFEDSKKNINAISLMMENFSNVSFKVIEVPHAKWLNDKRMKKIK
tara:strand:- start:384 stop:965 length:582 start_codon:yes stop_codon:yes gene_type:complete